MKKKKIHIDHLFRNAFNHLNLPISDSDLNEMNKKMDKEIENSPFHNFELPINENDWLLTKTKLNLAQEVKKHNNPFSQLEEFELTVANNDWEKVKNKLNKRKKKRILFILLPFLLLFTLGYLFYQRSSNISNFSEKVKVVKEIDKNTNFDNKIEENSTKNSQTNIEEIESNKIQSQISISNNKKILKEAIGSKEKSNKEIFDLNENISSNDNILKNIDENKNNNLTFEVESFDRILPISLEKIKPNFKQLESFNSLNFYFPKLNINKPKYYVGLNSEILNQSRILSSKNSKEYNKIRNNSENNILSSQNGLVFGIDFKKINFQTGINHLTFQNITNYNYEVLVHDSIPHFDPNGKLIGHFLLNPRYKQTKETVTKRMSSILIPIQLQKSFKLNAKNNLMVGVGINPEWVYLQKQNKFLDPNRLQHLKINSEVYNQFNFQTSLNLGIRTKLNKNWTLQSGITGNYQLNNVIKKSIGVKENPYNYGINFKLLYYLK